MPNIWRNVDKEAMKNWYLDFKQCYFLLKTTKQSKIEIHENTQISISYQICHICVGLIFWKLAYSSESYPLFFSSYYIWNLILVWSMWSGFLWDSCTVFAELRILLAAVCIVSVGCSPWLREDVRHIQPSHFLSFPKTKWDKETDRETYLKITWNFATTK